MLIKGLSPDTFRMLVALAIAQIVGWGTLGIPAVAGPRIAGDLDLPLAWVFAGSSVLYAVMGLLGPVLASAFTRHGARPVMITGAVIAAPGFALFSLAQGPAGYFLAWVVLGVAGAATLSTAAYIFLNERLGKDAKGAIGTLMLATGLSSSIFWPTTAWLMNSIGWRSTCLVYAAGMLLICLPLYVFGLSGEARSQSDLPHAAQSETGRKVPHSTFYLLATVIGLNAFVTFGLASLLIQLLQSLGLSLADAVALGSLLGIIQVTARGIDSFGGGRWDGITTGLVAGVALPVAMLLLILGGSARWAILAFIVLYGLGSGALAVARVTIPLVFYDKADYARAVSRVALPLNLLSATAPPILAGLLTHVGGDVVLAVTTACSLGALAMLVVLNRRRPVSDHA